jgi:hypothetical protein
METTRINAAFWRCPTKLSALIAPLLRATALYEQVLAVMLAVEAQLGAALEKAEAIVEQSRAKARARLQKWRDRQRGNVALRSETDGYGLARAVERNSNWNLKRKTCARRGSVGSG